MKKGQKTLKLTQVPALAHQTTLFWFVSLPQVLRTLLCSAILIVVFLSSSCKNIEHGQTKISHSNQNKLVLP